MFLRHGRPGEHRTFSPWVAVAIGVGMVLVGIIFLAIDASEGFPAQGRALVAVPAGVVVIVVGIVMWLRGKRFT